MSFSGSISGNRSLLGVGMFRRTWDLGYDQQVGGTHPTGMIHNVHNYSISFLIIMKDEGPKVRKLVKTNSALDFLKNNTSSASTLGLLFLIKSSHRVLTTT